MTYIPSSKNIFSPSANSSFTSRWVPLFALLLAAFLLFFRLGALPLISPDEGRNAEVAREMNLAGAWLVPSYTA